MVRIVQNKFEKNFFYNQKGQRSKPGLSDFNLFLPFIKKGISFIKFKWIKCLPVTLLNVARFLPISLPGPVLKLNGERASASLMGWTGWTGGRSPKVSFNFFHFKITY